MRRCTRCVLPETFPRIKFNDKGVCNYCLDFKGKKKSKEDKAVYFNKFKKLIKQIKSTHDYDCTLSYSGGKDSSYTLYILKKVFNLRVLTLTLDNGFLPEQTLKNIRNICENLEVDNMIFKPDFEVLKKKSSDFY